MSDTELQRLVNELRTVEIATCVEKISKIYDFLVEVEQQLPDCIPLHKLSYSLPKFKLHSILEFDNEPSCMYLMPTTAGAVVNYLQLDHCNMLGIVLNECQDWDKIIAKDFAEYSSLVRPYSDTAPVQAHGIQQPHHIVQGGYYFGQCLFRSQKYREKKSECIHLRNRAYLPYYTTDVNFTYTRVSHNSTVKGTDASPLFLPIYTGQFDNELNTIWRWETMQGYALRVLQNIETRATKFATMVSPIHDYNLWIKQGNKFERRPYEAP